MTDYMTDDTDLSVQSVRKSVQSVGNKKSEVDEGVYTLNLIDTPGHVDFSYEVSRSIAACEGALLVVDASQGVQAQTISNLYMAIDHDLEIIPVINKIDMPSAMPDEVEDEIVELLGCDPSEIIRASGRTGEGVEDILKVYLPAGFSQFKIEGRSLGSAVILEFLLYYMTKPEYRLRVREEIYLSSTLDLF